MKKKLLSLCLFGLTSALVASVHAADPTETEKTCARFKTLISTADLAPFFKGTSIQLKIEPSSYSSLKEDSARCAIRVLDAGKTPKEEYENQIFWAAIAQFKQAKPVYEKDKKYFLDMPGAAEKMGKVTVAIKSMADSYSRPGDSDMVDVLTTRGDTVYFYMSEHAKRMGQAGYHNLIKTIVDKLDSPSFDSLRQRTNTKVL